jgi:hypothetical protein
VVFFHNIDTAAAVAPAAGEQSLTFSPCSRFRIHLFVFPRALKKSSTEAAILGPLSLHTTLKAPVGNAYMSLIY